MSESKWLAPFRAMRDAHSDAGRVKRALVSYFGNVGTKVVRTVELELFDVCYLRDFPTEGVSSAISKGFGHFPVNACDSKRVRRELAITFSTALLDCCFDSVLAHVAERILQLGRPLDASDGEAFDFSSIVGTSVSEVDEYVVLRGVWFAGRNRTISEELDLRVAEVVPVSRAERELLLSNSDEFVRLVNDGSINLLDLRRKGQISY